MCNLRNLKPLSEGWMIEFCHLAILNSCNVFHVYYGTGSSMVVMKLYKQIQQVHKEMTKEDTLTGSIYIALCIIINIYLEHTDATIETDF